MVVQPGVIPFVGTDCHRDMNSGKILHWQVPYEWVTGTVILEGVGHMIDYEGRHVKIIIILGTM